MSSTIQRSFAAGELAPALYARADLARYAIGLRTCRNMIVQRAGGATKRTGTRFVVSLGTSDAFSLSIPTTLDLTESDTGGLTATLLDQNGDPVTDQEVTWESDDDSIATVASTGPLTATVTGVLDGTVNIRARVAGLGIVSNDCAVTFTDVITLHTFTTDDTFEVSASGTVSLLVVAHGGNAGTGTNYNGGGGGGVVRVDNVPVVAGQSYDVEVGDHGEITRFGHGQFSDLYKAAPGFDAATFGGDSPGGFTGGGAGGYSNPPLGITGHAGGGGAGAAADGANAVATDRSAAAGAGGDGKSVSIWRGDPLVCAGGGGGGAAGDNTTAAAGGLGGGGQGGNNVDGADGAPLGTTQLGGGGGGGPNGLGAPGAIYVWYTSHSGVVATGGDVSTV